MPSDETPWWHEGSGPDPEESAQRGRDAAADDDAGASPPGGGDPIAFAADAAAQAARAAEALLRQARVAGWQESVAGGLGLLGAFMRAAADGGREPSPPVSVDRIDDDGVFEMDVVEVEVVEVEVVEEPDEVVEEPDEGAVTPKDGAPAAEDAGAPPAEESRVEDASSSTAGPEADEALEAPVTPGPAAATGAEAGRGWSDGGERGARHGRAAGQGQTTSDPLSAFSAWLSGQDDDDRPRSDPWSPSSLPPELAAWAQLGADVLASGLAGTRDHLRTGECRSCPFCRGLALVRQSNPDVVDGIGDALDVIVSMLSSPDADGWPRR